MFAEVVQFNQEVIKIQPRQLGLMKDEEVKFTEAALLEEIEELMEAHENGDIIGCIDALIDGIIFAIGALYKLGMTPDQMRECFLAVHQANMTKKKGVTSRGHENDAIKPEGWVSPEVRIGQILEAK